MKVVIGLCECHMVEVIVTRRLRTARKEVISSYLCAYIHTYLAV